MPIMLTLDTSTTCTGAAVWKNGELQSVTSLYSTPGELCRDMEMIKEIILYIVKIKPDIVICEDLNVINNIAVAKKLSGIIGAVNGVCIYKNIFFDKISPKIWRKLITGENTPPKHRKELKQWDIEQVKILFNIDVKNDDEADAVLLGEAYKRLCILEGEE